MKNMVSLKKIYLKILFVFQKIVMLRSKQAFYMLTKEICSSLDIKHIHLRLGIPYSSKKDSNFYLMTLLNEFIKMS